MEPGPISPRDLKRLLARFPASDRATIAWTVPTVTKAISRLEQEPLTSALVDDVAREVLPALHALGIALIRGMGRAQATPAEREGIWRNKLPKIRALFSSDPRNLDNAEWVLRGWMQLSNAMLSLPSPTLEVLSRAQPNQETLVQYLEAPSGVIIRVEVLMMAILDLADANEDDVADAAIQSRAAELAQFAFLEFCKCLDALARAGVILDPFQGETSEERTARAARYADDFRNAISQDDMQILLSACST